jgi:hypothetical protein
VWLSEESIRLWKRHVPQYVKSVSG